ncbi:LysR substrate-binding domain-containing protein [Balneatrix alpica]|uniref:LysR substrate-binding domain-containing protein n=1 Tax=Balneatrix alpica TaxID=75684 RepID=A0ABV5Z7U1_9GAMM|nr:LysR substrate-binding domain-containing protein [Balneatrix alpica]
MLKTPELTDLHIFQTVAHTGSVTQAAQQLHRVQSNISTRLKHLEELLDEQLFWRQGKGMELTPAGERLLSHSEQLLKQAAEIYQVVKQDEPSGPLRIGSMESTAAVRIPVILAELHQCYPKLAIRLQTGPSQPIAQQVLDRQLDVAFVAHPPEHEQLQQLAIWQEHLVGVSARDGEHQGYLLAFTRGCSYRMVLEQWSQMQGGPQRPLLELNSYHGILSCASAGMGLGIVPRSLLEVYPYRHALQEHPLPTQLAQVTTYMIWLRQRQQPGIEALKQALSQHSAPE